MNMFNLIFPEKSDILFKLMNFPDNQPHIKIDMASISKLSRSEPVRIYTRISNSSDLLLALFIKNTLDYLEFEKVELSISYLMAGRMDRVMVDGEPFSLKVIADILNQGNFKRINIFDPHSEITTALINRSYAISNQEFVKESLDDYFSNNEKEMFCLISPDAGALKKYISLLTF